MPATLVPRPETEMLVDLASGQLGRDASCADPRSRHRHRLHCHRDPRQPADAHGRWRSISAPRRCGAAPRRMPRGTAWPTALRRCGRARGSSRSRPGERFDLIVSNPPYIETAVIADLAPRGARPRSAAGARWRRRMGWRPIAISPPARCSRLQPGGALLVEIGSTQGAAVAATVRARPGSAKCQ